MIPFHKLKPAAVCTLFLALLCFSSCAPLPSAALAQESVSASPAQTEAAAGEPAPEPAPSPSPAPDPAPLGIKKQTLSFAELAPTTTMTFAELVGDNGVYEDETEIPPLPSSDTYKLVINEYWQIATVYTRDEAGEYTVPVRYMIVTTGASDTPSPKGVFNMEDNYVRFGLFSVGVYGQYWRQITRSIYTHSLLYLHRNANSYTNSYSRLGRRGSHGCIRMMVPDARWVYYHIAPGSTCEIVKGNKNDAESKAIKEQLVFPSKPSSRPGLKAGEIPVTEAWPGWQGNAQAAYEACLSSLQAQE